MRLVFCLSLLLASGAWAADEAADRVAIDKVIATLSSSPDSPGLFTTDFADGLTLTRLEAYSDEPAAGVLKAMAQCDPHQIWGELNPCVPKNLLPSSRFAIRSIRWVTPNVALVDAVNDRRAPGISLRSPVLLVLRKEGDAWKLASVRMMVQPDPPIAQ